MDERDTTIQHLKNRDQKLRDALEQLTFRHAKKNEHAHKGLHNIRVKLTSLKWTTQLLSDNADMQNDDKQVQLNAIVHSTAELVRMVEDLKRTLEDPA